MIRSGLFIVACAAVAAPAFAHHGPGTFELNKTVTFDNATLTVMDALPSGMTATVTNPGTRRVWSAPTSLSA